MPFRAGNGTKELFMFQEYAKAREKKHRTHSRRNSKLTVVDDHHDNVPVWVPGFVLFPLPGQPWWLFDLDAAFWANFLYVMGSVIYVAQGIYAWHYVAYPALTEYDDYNPNNPSNYLNVAGAAVFIANASVSFVDWWLCAKQASVMNLSIEHVGDESSDLTEGKFLVEDMGKRVLTLYFWNNVFFMLAAITWVIGGVWIYDNSTDTVGCLAENQATGVVKDDSKCISFYIPFTASSFYLISALCGIWEYFETAKFRKASKLPPLKMFTTDFYALDWFGWGDWLYLLASLLPWIQSFVTGFAEPTQPADLDPDERMNFTALPIYNCSNYLFLIDSIVYYIGYHLFVLDIIKTMKRRHDEEEEERKRHGNIDHLHSSSMPSGLGDESEETSDYVKNAVNKLMLRREATVTRDVQTRRASNHGAAIMNMGRGSFKQDFMGGSGGIVLSPLNHNRASFSNQPGVSPFGQRLSIGNGDSAAVVSALAQQYATNRNSGGGGFEGAPPPTSPRGSFSTMATLPALEPPVMLPPIRKSFDESRSSSSSPPPPPPILQPIQPARASVYR